MDETEFDRIADRYCEQHSANIARFGGSPEFFSAYKIKELKRIVDLAAITVSKICDFGSGIGNSIAYFRQYFPEAELMSADVSRRSLELSKLRFPESKSFLLIEGKRIPAGDETFDLAFSACVFHHISEAEHIVWLRELFRITRTGGLIAIFEHNPLNPLTVRAVNACPFDINARLIHARQLRLKLLSVGWMSPSIEYHVFFPRVLASLRPLEQYLRRLPFGAQFVVYARKGTSE
jgi:SAM-dependent methyltransferase